MTLFILLLFCQILFINLSEDCDSESGNSSHLPLVVSTWATNKFQAAAQKAWDTLQKARSSGNVRMQSLVAGLTECERLRCDLTVGYGGSPDELGETTLDSLLMDGPEHKSGAVAAMRRVRQAAQVAWAVMNFTKHSLLVGEKATQFALSMGFEEKSLTTDESEEMHKNWLEDKCQPNFWKNVHPDPRTSCGPYHPNSSASSLNGGLSSISKTNSLYGSYDEFNHDTLGMIVVSKDGHISAGTSSNGASNKIPGRVGDSPIPGSGAYVDDQVGAAVATGDGDVMMRFSPSFLAVELMLNGHSPMDAAAEAIRRIQKYYPHFFGAIIVVSRKGEYGAGCSGMDTFYYSLVQPATQQLVVVQNITCIKARKSKRDK